MTKTERKLGTWAAILSAVFAVLWFITFNMKDFFRAVPDWQNLTAYADAFRISRFTLIYPSLLLALTYLVLLVSFHRVLAENKKTWSLIALVVGILYAAMASINYNIQAVSVRMSLAAGQTQGIEMFIPDNLNSIFNALANSYVYMSLSMFFAGFAYQEGKLEKWIRGLLLVQIVPAIGQIGYSMFDWPEMIFILTSMVWVIGAPIAFVLMAIWFNRSIGRDR
ncbi:MAG: hypothetical protein PVG54_01680 [Anaerolineae bacterium]|jgi:hypothetical protein